MKYDPIKNVMFKIVKAIPALRSLFFAALDLLFLRQWYVKRKISDCFKSDASISFYDAGSGFCQYSDYILKHWKHSKVFALDLKTDYLKDYAIAAEQNYPQRFSWVEGDLVLYKPLKKFNLIAAIDILEHIEDDKQVLANFYECLEPGGKLVISTPSNLDEAARFTAEHVRPGYNPDELKSKLKEAGFAIKSFEFSYGKWGKLSWKLAMKYPLQLVSYSIILMLVLPIYYICLYPVIYLLMHKDITSHNNVGNGLVVVAEKPITAS